MNYKITELNELEVEDIENRLSDYDKTHITYNISGSIRIGVKHGDKLIAGVEASITAFKILYISTVFVDEGYRNNKIGTLLMNEVEKRSRLLGANMIRLDTFNWQGQDFYHSLNYEEVGYYESKEEGFSEHFFLKRL